MLKEKLPLSSHPSLLSLLHPETLALHIAVFRASLSRDVSAQFARLARPSSALYPRHARGRGGQRRVAITISGHCERTGAIPAPINWSAYSLSLRISMRCSFSEPLFRPASRSLAPRPPAVYPRPRNYKHSFHTKSGALRTVVRNESRASRIFATDCHPLALPPPPPPHRHIEPLAARFTDGAALFQISTITGRRVHREDASARPFGTIERPLSSIRKECSARQDASLTISNCC